MVELIQSLGGWDQKLSYLAQYPAWPSQRRGTQPILKHVMRPKGAPLDQNKSGIGKQ